jgi:hypothetical protein
VPLRQRSSSANESVSELCFKSSEPYNDTLVAAGAKLPCGYALHPSCKTVTYWEEAACPETLLTNCYCYALDRYMKGYCTPGLRSVSEEVAVTSCPAVVEGLLSDGARRVSKQTVYSKPPPPHGHYVALAVWPGSDFHFWRLDSNGAWSGKRGDTFVTNTHPNGTLVTDVEDPAALGLYHDFCGYFLVVPSNITLVPTGFSAQSIPSKVETARRSGISVKVTPLPHPSWGWARQSYAYLLFGLDAAMWESGDRPLSWGYGSRGGGGGAVRGMSTRQLLSPGSSSSSSSDSSSSDSSTGSSAADMGSHVLPMHSTAAATPSTTPTAAAAAAGEVVRATVPHGAEPMWLSRIRWHLQPPVTVIDWSMSNGRR